MENNIFLDINKLNIQNFKRRLDFREKLKLDHSIVDILRCRKCDIRVLVVTDSFLYFSDENFGLSDFIGILESTSHASANFVVTKAHRGDPGTIRLNGGDKDFKFTSSSLNNIDVVFMFAAGRTSPVLMPSELKSLAEFMDSGGGVFATGDHDWLGRAMCGDLMRVRSMRKWFFPTTGPFGEPVAPDGGNADRHDTNRPGHNTAFSFNDQSDDIPQKINPIYESVNVLFKRPHPILCGNNGVLKYLPDHPHEGECITPWELDRNFDYSGTSFAEYPLASNGTQPLPKVIATATMLPGAQTSSKPPIAGGTFGVMSAYDGHLAQVGRVHCDATWHHFININLTGDDNVNAPDPKSMGFLASTSGQTYYEEIKNYYRNIVLWLAPVSKQRCMRNRWLWNVIRDPIFVEDFGALKFNTKKITLAEAANVGKLVLAYPALHVTNCHVRKWLIDLVLPELVLKIPEFECLLDPCVPSPRPGPDPMPFFDPEVVLEAAVGNLALSMFKESNDLDKSSALKGPDGNKLDKMVKSSSQLILKMMSEEFETAAKTFGKFSPMLK